MYFFRKRNVEVRETTLPTKYTREMMCYFTPFDFDVLGTCHEVASFFVSFVDLSEDTSHSERTTNDTKKEATSWHVSCK